MNIDKDNRKIISGALSLTISAFLVKFLGLIYKIPLSYLLSEEGMGYFNSAYTVYTFFYLICTAGVPKAISILTSSAYSEGDIEKTEEIYKTAFKVFSLVGLFFTTVLVFFSSPIAKLIGNSKAALTMISIAPSIMFVCASGVIRGYLNGIVSFFPVAVSEVISGISRLVLGILFAFAGYKLNYDFEIISAMTILGTTLGSFFSLIYLSSKAKIKKSKNKAKQKDVYYKNRITKEILKISLPLTVTSAIGSLSGIIDLGIIMRRFESLGYTELQAGIIYGNYTTLVIPMFNLVSTLFSPLSAVLLPLVSRNEIKNNRSELSLKISFSLKILSVCSIPIIFIYSFFGETVLSFLFEDSSAKMAYPMLAAIAPGLFFMCILTVINTALEGVGKIRIPLMTMIVSSIVKIVFSYILIGNEKYGILGSSVATVISYITGFLISYIYTSVAMKIDLKLFSSVIKPLVSASFASVLCFFVKYYLKKNSMLFDIANLILFCFFYLFFMCILNIKDLKSIKKLSKYTKRKMKDYL